MVELIPQAKKPRPAYPFLSLFFRGAILFFVLAVVLFAVAFSLVFFRQRELSRIAKQSEVVLDQKSQKILGEMEGISKQILSSRKIVNSLLDVLEPLKLMEKIVRPKVRLTEFSFDARSFTASLKMRAADLAAFWEQVHVLRSDEVIKEVEISDFKTGAGGEISFSVSAVFNFPKSSFLWQTK